MSEYYEVYRRRAGHFGTNPQQRALKSGQREFKQYLHYSEHTVRGLKHDDLLFDGVILTHKQDENQTSLKLLVDLCVDLKIGDLIEWNGGLWLIWFKTISSYQPYNKFEIIKCNYVISWVDEEGLIQSSPCHIIGSKESKIKENFRTWNELITPQPNKFIEIIMPYRYIRKNTEIIVSDEAWRLVDYDKVSVPGVIYLSFTEAKVNELTDDMREQLANADKVQEWRINISDILYVSQGDIINLKYTISKDGIIKDNVKPQIVYGSGLEVDSNDNIIASQVGETNIALTYENAFKEVKIIVGEKKNTGFISGNDFIRVTRKADYTFISDSEMPIDYSIDKEELATVIPTESGCTVYANDKNKNGTVILSANCNGTIYTKAIRIISLWQEV